MDVKENLPVAQAPTWPPRRPSGLSRLLSSWDKKMDSSPRPLLKGVFGALQARRASTPSLSPSASDFEVSTSAPLATDAVLNSPRRSASQTLLSTRPPEVLTPKARPRSFVAFTDMPRLSDMMPASPLRSGDAKMTRAAAGLRGADAPQRRTQSLDAQSGLGLPPAPTPEESYLSLFVRRAAILATDIAQAPIARLSFDLESGIHKSQRCRDLQRLRAISQPPRSIKPLTGKACWTIVGAKSPLAFTTCTRRICRSGF